MRRRICECGTKQNYAVFADDLTLLSHSVNDMLVKTQDLEASAALTGLQINKDKTKIMKVKTDSSQAVTLANDSIDEVQEFTYLEVWWM